MQINTVTIRDLSVTYMLLLVLVNDSIRKQGLLTGKGECYSPWTNITRS